MQGLARLADAGGPEAGLLDAVPLPDPQRDRLEPAQEIRQATWQAMINAKLVKHVGVSLFHRREAGRQQDRVADRGDDRAVGLGRRAFRLPFGVGLESREFLRALVE